MQWTGAMNVLTVTEQVWIVVLSLSDKDRPILC